MKKKLEVEITRDRCEVTAKCIYLDAKYIDSGVLVENRALNSECSGYWFIATSASPGIAGGGLYIWKSSSREHTEAFDTEEEAIEWADNITKLIDKFNGEEVKSTPRVVIPEEMLDQDKIDEGVSDLDSYKDVPDIIEIVAGINNTYNLESGWSIEWDFEKDYKKECDNSSIYVNHDLFDEGLEFNIGDSRDIQKCNEALKKIGMKAKIVEPRETTTIKSIDGVEFKVYLEELNNIVDNIK